MFSFWGGAKEEKKKTVAVPVSNAGPKPDQLVSLVDKAIRTPGLFAYEELGSIRGILIDFTHEFPSMLPKAEEFISDSGSSIVLLHLEGTIPIIFQGNQYNIPIGMWLTENFPLVPPLSFVTPVSGMKIKPKHENVDGTGIIYLPYLSDWKPEISNLIDLVKVMIEVFSRDPPVYKPVEATGHLPSQSSLQAQTQSQFSPSLNTFAQPMHGSQQANVNPGAFPYSYGIQSGSNRPITSVNTQSVDSPSYDNFRGIPPAVNPISAAVGVTASKKDVLTKDVTKMIASYLQTVRDDALVRGQALLDTKEKMQANTANLLSMRVGLEAEETAIIAKLNKLGKESKDIERWMEENKADYEKQVDFDSLFLTNDILAKQMFELSAEDAAIEDAIYVLENALQNEKIQLPAFLKHVRKLAHDQFMIRALGKKIYEKQALESQK